MVMVSLRFVEYFSFDSNTHADPYLSTSVSIFPCGVAMHTLSNVPSIFLKKCLSHLNGLKYLGALMTELSVTKGYSPFVSFIASFTSLVLALT